MDAAHVDFIPPAVYSELLSHLHKKHSTLSPTEAVACALRLWMAQSSASRSPLRGYQWKELFLPDTTCLRMTYKDMKFFAKVVDDDIVFRGHPVTPRLNAAMLLIRHVDHQSTTIAERRLPKHRRQSDLLDDDH